MNCASVDSSILMVDWFLTSSMFVRMRVVIPLKNYILLTVYIFPKSSVFWYSGFVYVSIDLWQSSIYHFSFTFIIACTYWSKIYVCSRNVCLRSSYSSLWVSHVLILTEQYFLIYLQFKMVNGFFKSVITIDYQMPGIWLMVKGVGWCGEWNEWHLS